MSRPTRSLRIYGAALLLGAAVSIGPAPTCWLAREPLASSPCHDAYHTERAHALVTPIEPPFVGSRARVCGRHARRERPARAGSRDLRAGRDAR